MRENVLILASGGKYRLLALNKTQYALYAVKYFECLREPLHEHVLDQKHTMGEIIMFILAETPDYYRVL